MSVGRSPFAYILTFTIVLFGASCTGSTEVCREGDALGCGTTNTTPVATSVTVSAASLTLTSIGQTQQLTAIVRDQNGQTMASVTVTWSSSNLGVVSVDNSGFVTAVANGTATITAAAGSAIGTASASVAQEVQVVTLSPSSATLTAIAETVQLTATAEDGNGNPVTGASIDWASSDATVAMVSSTGLVTAVATGTAAITASSGAASAASSITVEDSCAAPAETAGLGTTSGALSSADCLLSVGSYADFYVFVLSNDATLQIDLSSGDFDAFLTLHEVDGSIIDSDDDGGSGLDSRIVGDLVNGSYRLGVTSIGSGTGSYTLTLTAIGCPAVDGASVGSSEFGVLSSSDCLLSDGSYADSWTLTVGSDDRVQIDLISSDYDTWLLLLDSDGATVAVNDDGHTTGATDYDLSSHIDLTLTTGTYEIIAGSLEPGVTGDYQLNVGPGLACVEEGVLFPGGASSGASLVSTDCLDGTFYTDAYAVQVVSSATITFDLTSTDFDAYLSLFDPAGNFIIDDDDGGVGLNSRISVSLLPGWYVIQASSALSTETGSYTLSIN